jgi:uncharacterized OB-fold protein
MLDLSYSKPDWSAKLTRPIVLNHGTALVTLSDARDCLLKAFSGVPESVSFGMRVELIFKAAKKPRHRRAATAQLQIVLQQCGLL